MAAAGNRCRRRVRTDRRAPHDPPPRRPADRRGHRLHQGGERSAELAQRIEVIFRDRAKTYLRNVAVAADRRTRMALSAGFAIEYRAESVSLSFLLDEFIFSFVELSHLCGRQSGQRVAKKLRTVRGCLPGKQARE